MARNLHGSAVGRHSTSVALFFDTTSNVTWQARTHANGRMDGSTAMDWAEACV